VIGLAIDLNRAELRQMIGNELGVEQAKPTRDQMRNQMDEGDLAGVACPRKHALAEEGGTESHPVKATY